MSGWRVGAGVGAALWLSMPALGGGLDVVSVDSNLNVVAGATISVPIRVRDLSLTPLGIDRPSGERIQGLAFRLDFAAPAISNASIVPAGIIAPLTASFGPTSNFAPGTVNFLVAYNETSNLIPFNLDAGAPGDLVAQLNLTVNASQSPGSVALNFNANTELSNQAGTIAENSTNGTLSRIGGVINVTSNAPGGLYARALSPTSIRLSWNDPQLVETGIRVERSTDGSNFVGVQDLGPDLVGFDDSGLSAATLYYYRVRTLVGATPGGASNRATASTHPALAAKICVDPAVVSRRWARSPDVAWRGPNWGLVYHDRDDGTHEQIYFQQLDGTTLAPLAPRIQLSNSATSAQFPGIAWNTTHYAVTWTELLRGAPGSTPASGVRFAQLDANGNLLRGPRRLDTKPLGFFGANEYSRPHWDGTHWGVFMPQVEVPFRSSIGYRRVEANGDGALPPVDIIASNTHYLFDFDAAWHSQGGEYGMVWVAQRDDQSQLFFQRLDESTGAVIGAPAVLTSLSVWDSVFGSSLVADAAGGWLAAWSECIDATGDCSVLTQRISAAGVPLGSAARISPLPGPADDVRPRLARRTAGYALFVELAAPTPEIGRYLLDANGLPDGLGRTPVSNADLRASGRPRVGSDGSRALVAWSESPSTLEVAGRISEAAGSLGATVAFTSGNSPGNTTAVIVPGQPRVAALDGGWVSVWPENASGTNLLHGRRYLADGTLAANYAPLSATPTSNRPGLVAVGGTFAVAWRAPGNLLRFARYAADGSVMVTEATVATGVGGGPVELGWDGENFAVVYNQGPQIRYLRISESGVAAGPPLVLALGSITTSGIVRIEWLGDGWALVWRDGAANLLYARFAADGSVLQMPVTFVPALSPFGTNDVAIAYDGTELGVAWAGFVGSDPPFNELFFTVVNRDGSTAFAPVALVPGGLADQPAQLHSAGGQFRLVYLADNEYAIGMRELSLNRTPGGVNIAASRYLANRGSNAAATAHDGSTLALAWRVGPSQDIHVETDACLVDPTPPPCPALTLASTNHAVRLNWTGVNDPESGIWRHHLYRDDRLLAELPASSVQYDDSGYDSAVIHSYTLRAFNRAFQESQACPAKAFSTTVGDANGNGALEVADIFYLINFLLSDGPAPLGDGDANGDGQVSVSDIFFVINYFFGGGPLPIVIEDSSR